MRLLLVEEIEGGSGRSVVTYHGAQECPIMGSK